jgi:hypothetical protein
MRTRTLCVLSILVTVAVTVAATLGPHRLPAPRREAGSVMGAASPTARALAVLRVWDRRRAAAWAEDDAVALRSLYVRGSTTARRDVAMLAAYERRGFRVRNLRRQVLAVRVRRSRPRLLTMVVTDRLVDATVSRAGVRTALPESRPATRRIGLRRVGRRWRVVEVYAR